MDDHSNLNFNHTITMITIKHISLPDRKRFSDTDDLITFLKKDPSPEMWIVNLDGFKCTGDEVVKHSKRTKTRMPRKAEKTYKQLLSEIKQLQKDVHSRIEQSEPVPEPVKDYSNDFQLTYHLTQ